MNHRHIDIAFFGMARRSSPVSRAELLPLPTRKGALGEIFESSVLHDMRQAAEGESNRHYIARAVVLVLEVHGRAEYGDETGRVEPLVPGSCFLVDPEVGHRYGPLDGSYWTEIYISFRGPMFESLMRLSHMMENPVRHLTPLDLWQQKLRNILPHPDGINEPDACNGRLLAFLTEAFPPLSVPGNHTLPWIDLAKRMLERENITIAEATARLSNITGLSPETLRKQFRHITGQSMKSWQLAGRIATAQSLLARGSMTQKEIAATLGFSSPQHFSRCIRKATGTTPARIAKEYY